MSDDRDILLEKLENLERLIGFLANRQTEAYEKKWLTEDEAQRYLGVGTTKLWELRTEGKLGYSREGKKCYYKLTDLETYLESNYNPPKQQFNGKTF